VRGGLVIGMPKRRVERRASKEGDLWTRIPLLFVRPLSVASVTSIGPLCGGSMPHSAAALRWLTTAPLPQASTAAMQRPSKLRRV